jgi:hypothetical protein
VAAGIAAVLGTASAAVSALWAVGSTFLLDTVGGPFERLGREGGIGVVVALLAIAALKLVVALAAPVLVGVGAGRLPTWTSGRVPRLLGWIAAITLTLYGGLLTVVGLLVEAEVVDASADADTRALAWHAYLWDPWFALWGAAFVVALGCTPPPVT